MRSQSLETEPNIQNNLTALHAWVIIWQETQNNIRQGKTALNIYANNNLYICILYNQLR